MSEQVPPGCRLIRYQGKGDFTLKDHAGQERKLMPGDTVIVTVSTFNNLRDETLAGQRAGIWEVVA